LAGCWYRAGLAKAERQYKDTPPGDPKARPLLCLLDQTKALWRLKDYAAMEKRFALAKRLNAPLSVESRRAGYLLADMLYYQRRFSEAADMIVAVQAENERVGDLGTLEKSDIGEMHWTQGLFLYISTVTVIPTPLAAGAADSGRCGGARNRFWRLHCGEEPR